MFIRFFKSGFPVQYITIGAIGIVLWIRGFIDPVSMPKPDGPVPLYTIIYDLLSGMPTIAAMMGFILVLGESFWLTAIMNKHELVLKNSSLSALVFFVLMSFIPDQLTITPINITLFFLILILKNLLRSYNKPEHLDLVYSAGFFIAVAGLFYIPFLIWFAFVPISFVIFRSGQWREWIVSLIGIVTPFIFLSVFYFWFNEFTARALEYSTFFRSLLFYPAPVRMDFWLIGGYTLLLALWGIFTTWSGPMEKTVEIRAKTNLFLWIILFSGFSFTFARSLAIYHFALAFPAFALVISGTLNNLKKTVAAEWIILVYFILVLLNNAIFYSVSYPN